MVLFHSAGVLDVGRHGDDHGVTAGGHLVGFGAPQNHHAVGKGFQLGNFAFCVGGADNGMTTGPQAARPGLADMAHTHEKNLYRM